MASQDDNTIQVPDNKYISWNRVLFFQYAGFNIEVSELGGIQRIDVYSRDGQLLTADTERRQPGYTISMSMMSKTSTGNES